MTSFDEIKDQANELLVTIQQYFQECSQNELIAWGAVGVGTILIIAGLIMIIF